MLARKRPKAWRDRTDLSVHVVANRVRLIVVGGGHRLGGGRNKTQVAALLDVFHNLKTVADFLSC